MIIHWNQSYSMGNFGTFTIDENDPLRREKKLMIKEREGWWVQG